MEWKYVRIVENEADMMKAFILAGGLGTRLRPYTYTTPKALMKVGGKPILQYVIENLKRNGVTDLIITVGYLKEQIISHFGDGSKFGVRIEWAEEAEPLGTAGSVLPHKEKLGGTFVVVMGDQLTNADLKGMIESHRESRCIASIGVKKQPIKIEYGVVEVGRGSRVRSFLEKPVMEKYINTAIYVFEPEVFRYINPREDFGKTVLPRLLEKGEKINAFEITGFWSDVGYVNEYEKIKDRSEKEVFSGGA